MKKNQKQFKKAVKEILLKPQQKRAKYENKKPTSKQLNTRFKLQKKI